MNFVRFNRPFKSAFRLLPFHKAVLLSVIYAYRMTWETALGTCLNTYRNGLDHLGWYGFIDDFGAVVDDGRSVWIGYQTQGRFVENALQKVFRLSTTLERIPEMLQNTQLVSYDTQETRSSRFECGCILICEGEKSKRKKTWSLCKDHQTIMNRWPQADQEEIARLGVFRLTGYTASKLLWLKQETLTDVDVEELLTVMSKGTSDGNLNVYQYAGSLKKRLQKLFKDKQDAPMPIWVPALARAGRSTRRYKYIKRLKEEVREWRKEFENPEWLWHLQEELDRVCKWPLLRCYLKTVLVYVLLTAAGILTWWWHLPDWKTVVTLAATCTIGYLGYRFYRSMWY